MKKKKEKEEEEEFYDGAGVGYTVPFVDELSRAEHDVRQRRLDEFPARDGPDGVR